MDVIFLDFDGVLNNQDSLIHHRLVNTNPKFFVSGPDHACVTFIDYLLYVTGAKIVISSSWRSNSLDNTKIALRDEFGLKRVDRVISQTPRLYNPGGGSVLRGSEISDWLFKTKETIDNFIIIDDDSDMLENQLKYFVHTDFKHGFTWDDCMKSIILLDKVDDESKVHADEDLITAFRQGKDYYKDNEK
jgi:hypothetical protein